MAVQPYLFFDGRCDEAIAFYQRVLGAQVMMLMRYKESPPPAMHRPEMSEKVMHAQLRLAGSEVLVSDGHCTGTPNFQGFALSVTVADEAESKRVFEGLSEGGQVRMPLNKTFFSPSFGMLTDRFGIMWMVYVIGRS